MSWYPDHLPPSELPPHIFEPNYLLKPDHSFHMRTLICSLGYFLPYLLPSSSNWFKYSANMASSGYYQQSIIQSTTIRADQYFSCTSDPLFVWFIQSQSIVLCCKSLHLQANILYSIWGLFLSFTPFSKCVWKTAPGFNDVQDPAWQRYLVKVFPILKIL